MHLFWKYNFWKNPLSLFWGHWGQEVIFEVIEAKFWISSTFNEFWFRIFIVLSFEVVWPQRPRRPLKEPRECFQKLQFWNQCIPAKKMSYVPALRSKFFTKSLHRGGLFYCVAPHSLSRISRNYSSQGDVIMAFQSQCAKFFLLRIKVKQKVVSSFGI